MSTNQQKNAKLKLDDTDTSEYDDGDNEGYESGKSENSSISNESNEQEEGEGKEKEEEEKEEPNIQQPTNISISTNSGQDNKKGKADFIPTQNMRAHNIIPHLPDGRSSTTWNYIYPDANRTDEVYVHIKGIPQNMMPMVFLTFCPPVQAANDPKI